jgi:uncharacterized protein YbjQ (UPF0145 family)
MSEELIVLLLQIGIPLTLLLLAMAIGSGIEKRHFKELDRKEAELAHIMVSDLRTLPQNWRPEAVFLVSGSVCIANDYFKTFVASLRKLFGGRIRAYESLVERARREAIVRMLQEARNYAANVVWNVRVETSSIVGQNPNRAGCVEVFAYGTAVRVPP